MGPCEWPLPPIGRRVDMVIEVTQALVAIAQSPQGGALPTLQAWADIAQKSAATVAIVGTAA